MTSPSRVTLVASAVDCDAARALVAQLPWGVVLERVLVVDARPTPSASDSSSPLLPDAGITGPLASRLEVLRCPGGNPVGARNVGWRAATTPWVAFLGEDARPAPGWLEALAEDLHAAEQEAGDAPNRGAVRGPGDPVVAVHGRVEVEPPSGRRPTERERRFVDRARAPWAATDAAYRRDVLAATGGLDERFATLDHAHLELDLRAAAFGRVRQGDRVVRREPPPGSSWPAVAERDRASDVLLRCLHGPGARPRDGPRATGMPWQVLTGALASVTCVAAAAEAVRRSMGVDRRRSGRVAVVGAAAWAASTTRLALVRLAPGPRTPREVLGILLTTPVQPLSATRWWLHGRRTARGATRWQPPPPAAVLIDRAVLDSTEEAAPSETGSSERAGGSPHAPAVQSLRDAGVRVGVFAVEEGVATGTVSATEVDAGNAALERSLGGVDARAVCPHGPTDGCRCRPPRPGLLQVLAQRLQADPADCAVVSDRAAPLRAAVATAARGLLCASDRTPGEEVGAAVERSDSLVDVVDRLLAGPPGNRS
ncbi:glycosyltransferase [Egibacter rhizosphaerae]|uniref:Glycosyltransferase n=1 Tax=Egibacter rhizosphaerae TaxID=1670831 RepID=A0A411YB49_9ACTN|nr:glycosyltransferase [Egibacter rhizosphaerae]QBI18397.1 glycosyltransferase [Egibacter rhizosphaerae]